jgi:CheY-like chemotaxis protein
MQVLARNIQNEINDTPVFTVVKTGKQILYIDDDPDDRENFGYALERCNAKITLTTAVDADDALEKLASQAKPACIYLDINMPKMNGIQLLKVLKSNTDFAQIPVIIFSTAVDTKSRKEAMNLGAAGVFVKPSSLQGLLDHLCASLSTHF